MMIKQTPWDLVQHYLGPIRHLFDKDGVTEICVNKFDEVYIEYNGRFEYANGVQFENEIAVATMITQIANALGQTVEKMSHPVLDARLSDGTRVCAPLHPVSVRGNSVSFRLFPKKRLTIRDLINFGSLNDEMAEILKMAIICHYNILLSGGTGSGKTTLLNCMSEFIPPEERVITVEDTHELKISVPNKVNLEAAKRRDREKGLKVDMAFLIKTCLRMNPSRIIVGEIRDSNAAIAFLHAINTGHTSCSTIHANSASDALGRIQTLIAGKGDLPFDVVKSLVRTNMNMIVHAEKTPRQGRKITAIAEIQNGKVVPIYEWDYKNEKHIKTDAELNLYKRIMKYQGS